MIWGNFLYISQIIESFAVQFSFQFLFLSVPYFTAQRFPSFLCLYPSYFLIVFFSFYALSKKCIKEKALLEPTYKIQNATKALKPQIEVRNAYVSQVFIRRSFVRCVWKWEIHFLHIIFARSPKIENKCQRAFKAKYIYITPQHIFIFIFRLMIF